MGTFSSIVIFIILDWLLLSMCFFYLLKTLHQLFECFHWLCDGRDSLTFNFITQRHISQITVCCLSNGVKSGQNHCSKMFWMSPGSFGCQFRVFFGGGFLSVIVFFLSLSLIVHGCEAQRGFMLMRLSAILVSFHFTLLLSLRGFIS